MNRITTRNQKNHMVEQMLPCPYKSSQRFFSSFAASSNFVCATISNEICFHEHSFDFLCICCFMWWTKRIEPHLWPFAIFFYSGEDTEKCYFAMQNFVWPTRKCRLSEWNLLQLVWWEGDLGTNDDCTTEE